MEMALPLHWPRGCKEATTNSSRFSIWLTPVVFSNPYKRNNHTTIRTVTVMRASSDYSRRRPRKSAMSKTNQSVPKGFAAKPQVRKSIQKKGRDPEVEQSDAFPSTKNFSSPGLLSEETADGKGESHHFHSISTITDNEVKSTTKLMEVGEKSNLADGDVVKQVEEIGTLKKEETIAYDFKDFEKSRMTGDESLKQNKLSEVSGNSGITVSKTEGQIGKSIITEKHAAADRSMEVVTTTVGDDVNLGEHDGQNEQAELLVKKNIEIEAQAHRNLLEGLAKENLASESKFFVYPKVIIADHVIEVYFNRSLSLLMNESDVFIKGAFNDWRWKDFTEKMHRSDLQGDWWNCQIYVPKEAYEMNFVFFNGWKVFENNNEKNFSEPVHGDMDEYAFEDLLLEEERKRLEKLAAKQSEKERQDKELHRRVEEQAAIEAARAQAKLEVEKKRESCQRLLALAVESVDGLWNIEHYLLNGESRLRLYYNRSSRPLEHCSDVWIHGGYNKWIEGLSIIDRLNKHEKKDGDWWYADVIVPDKALILDWVFADGPPQHAKVYDNNNYQDFHAIIKIFPSEETYWLEEEDRLFKKLWEERLLKEAISLQKAEKTTRLKAETKERTLRRFLLSQKHVVYTEPLFIHAGKMVRVLYNLSNTILNGKEKVWFNYSFNRWSHRIGQLPPQKMVPVGNGTHLQAFVKVPLDAYVMDFVFSEKENGGVYDNKNGMDYHIPVIGGIAKEAPLHIVHVAVEMAPIAKVGGLGDVVTSLSRAVQDLGHKVDIILPKYDCLKLNHVKNFHHHTSFFWGGTEIKVWYGKVEGLCVYFLEPQNGMFWAGCIYGKNNDGDRFGFFCHAALEFLLQNGFQPDILHCHDWSSAPVTWLFKEHYQKIGLSRARVIFTIHNLEFGIHQIGKAMISTDKATTVSHTYSKEISRSSVISSCLYKFHGIVNGIDPDIWDPYNDDFIPVSYTSENVTVGKNAAKAALQQRLGLKRVDCPLIGIISRLTVQKGVDLIKHTIWRTLERSGQVVLLGSAPDSRIQNDFINLANRLHSTHYDHARLCLTYDEPLSHLIYAGADFIIVPSIFEPCGLTQLVAMRYGSIPVVRKTGGLYDTVFDVDNDKERAESAGLEPNGYSFESADSRGIDYALNRAISAWYDKREWLNQLCKRVMEQDWSWNRPAMDYIELYYAARKNK